MLLSVFYLLATVTAQVVIEDFSESNPLARWSFSNGPEFPGATGNLTLTPTSWGTNSARLTYNFEKGGHYVAAIHSLPQPLYVEWLSMVVRSPACLHPELRAVDSTGQTLQFTGLRPLENSQNESEWYLTVIDIKKSSSFWGGANDGIFHGNLTSVSILAADPCEPATAATMDFAKLVGYASPQAFVPKLIAAAKDVGPLPPRSGVNIHFLNDSRALDIAHSVRVQYVRMDLDWSAVERVKGSYDFSKYDVLITELTSREMKAHFIFDYSNALYNPPSCPACSPASPEAVSAFANFAAAAVTHFEGSVDSYEVYNEPNIAFWKPQPDPVAYRTLLAATVTAVKKAVSGVRVSSGGISTFDFPFFRSMLETKAGGADAVGVHPYRPGSPESAGTDFLHLRSLVEQAMGPSVPVLDTEWGYSSAWFGDGHSASARQQQAVLGVRRILTSWSLDCPLLVYYDIRDDGSNTTYSEDNFGMIAQDDSDKPLMSAYRTLSQHAGDLSAAFLQRPLLTTEGIWLSSVHAFQLGSNQIVVWIETGSVDVRVPLTTKAFNMYGVSVTLKPVDNMLQLILNDIDGPAYLQF